eukprot:470815-Amorphochlora_amoeboformis.AAC.1
MGSLREGEEERHDCKVTDSVINVPTEPPPIVQEDPTSLLTIAGVWKGSESGDLDIDRSGC